MESNCVLRYLFSLASSNSFTNSSYQCLLLSSTIGNNSCTELVRLETNHEARDLRISPNCIAGHLVSDNSFSWRVSIWCPYFRTEYYPTKVTSLEYLET